MENVSTSARTIFAEGHELGLHAKHGCPFAGMNFAIYQGELTAVRGRSGTGKTALLLALAGRLATTDGELEVLGEELPRRRRKVLKRIGLGFFQGVNDLPGNVTVALATAAELGMFKRANSHDDVMAYLGEWGLMGVSNVQVRDLAPETAVMLGVALGMAGNPEALMVDDIETNLAHVQSQRIMGTLRTLAHQRGVTVVVGCLERSLAALADATVPMA